MSEGQPRKPEAEVTADGNALSRLMVKAAVVAIVPAIVTFAWLGLLREPQVQADSARAIASIAVQARATLIENYAQDLIKRVEQLAQTLPTDSPAGRRNPVAMGFPDADTITIIPLDDLGTVNIEPGQHGINSHIGIDIVRRAFAGETPFPESVLQESTSYTLLASSYGEPRAGVVLVQVVQTRLNELVSSNTGEGDYELIQRSPSGAESHVVGKKHKTSTSSTADINGTPWLVRFTPDDSWLSEITPSWVELALAIVFTLGGVALGLGLLLTGIPALIQRETDHILESADLRTPLRVGMPALVPLAKMIRQLSLLSRRQLVTNARREATQIEEPKAEDAQPQATQEQAMGDLRGTDLEEDADTQASEFDDTIPGHIFRDTCIRGDVETELTDELVEKIANALAVMAGERGIQTLVIAYDSRPSSKKIRTILVKALLSGGRDIIDIGEVPTPLLHFATHDTSTTSGIMITGGHSPENINGFKIIFDRKTLTGSDIDALLELVRAGRVGRGSGRTAKQDVQPDYVDKIAVDVALALPLKVVIDNDFGCSANIAPHLFTALDCDVVSTNTPEDGPRPENWSLPSALQALGDRVKAEGADLGVLFDSDGDRLHTVTNAGTPVATDQLMMILAKDLLERNPGADVVYDVMFSRNFAPFVTRAGGRAQMSRSGAAFVSDKMRQTSALLAADFSGHIFYEERWFGFSDAMYSLARLLEILAAETSDYEAVLAELPKGVSTPKYSIPVDERTRRKVMRGLTENPEFPGAKITTIDGLRIDYADGWALVRGSTTDAALNLRFEGNDETSLARVRNVIYKAINRIEPDLELPQ